ncbi:MAG TPA: hypothetical protein VGX23_04600, partial [Actinocrinis sp.]|nr:hypothetical protein [Actinocrinis sp.]
MRPLPLLRLPAPARGRPRPRRKFRATLAALAISTISLVALPSVAHAAGDAPFGGTAAAVPGTVQAANYDTGGQGVAYSVTATNGSANSYRADGIDLETTADTQDT